MFEQDVVIVGSGCTGIFLAQEIAHHGLRCLVLHERPAAKFSSTRNQGWLQSGALYACIGDRKAAAECRAGHQYVSEAYPEVVHSDIPSYFLFNTKDELDSALARCAKDSLDVRKLSASERRGMCEKNPILSRMPHPDYVAATRDRPADTHLLLQKVAASAMRKGVRYCEVDSVADINALKEPGGWRVGLQADGVEITCKCLVLACGVYINKMLAGILDDGHPALPLTKIPVLILKSDATRVSNSSLIMPFKGAPNVVPFRRGQEYGVSVCLMGKDVEIKTADDDGLPSWANEVHAKALEDFLPGMKKLVTDHRVTAHFYVCQKIRTGTRGSFLEYQEDWPDGDRRLLVTFYPGKFTSSPVSAQRCAREISARLGFTTVVPPIADQLYFEASTLRVKFENDRLGFEPRREWESYQGSGEVPDVRNSQY
ncbi:NAD(P)/FAD-dependent oxidoreductase [Streptomyces sp. NPDC059970]|uniref:NAD(P)/FAD-dependent oxidoreductase n=1 Tax=Streptomyces sp. NPDC059970 TaxID=3347019 RepID=UPI0036B66CC0